jgi:hypothetical protein
MQGTAYHLLAKLIFPNWRPKAMRTVTLLFLAAVTIATVPMAEFFGASEWWPWVSAGCVGIAVGICLVIVRHFEEPYRGPSSRDFHRRARLSALTDYSLRERVEEALHAWRQCEKLVQIGAQTPTQDYLKERLGVAREAVLTIHHLASFLDQLQQKDNLDIQLVRSEAAMRKLRSEIRAATVTDERARLLVRLDAARLVRNSRKDRLNAVRLAHYQLDGAVALLQALHAAMEVVQTAGLAYLNGLEHLAEGLEHEMAALNQSLRWLETSASETLEAGENLLDESFTGGNHEQRLAFLDTETALYQRADPPDGSIFGGRQLGPFPGLQ